MLVVGPDGVGKTTVCHALVARAPQGVTIETDRRAMLPRRTKVMGTEPHPHEPFPLQVSIGKTLYYFADALLNWALWVRPVVRRGVWIIRERGWWDMAVDPKRYRLQPHQRLFRLLGHLLPQPDLIVVLEGDPALIWSRKPELSQEEIARQRQAWHALLPAGQRRAFVDVALPVDEVVRVASRELESVIDGSGAAPTGSAPTGAWSGVAKPEVRR